MTIDQAFDLLHSLPADWGASEKAICEVEALLGLRLPATLRELMLCTGGEGHMEWLFPNAGIGSVDMLPELQEIAAEILARDRAELYLNFRFVTLSQDQGYYFSLVRADNQDPDPEVLSYCKGRGLLPSDGLRLRQTIALALMRTTVERNVGQ